MSIISRCECMRRNELRDYEPSISLLVCAQLEMVLYAAIV